MELGSGEMATPITTAAGEYTVVMENEAIEKLVVWLEKAKDLLSQRAMWLEVQETESRPV